MDPTEKTEGQLLPPTGNQLIPHSAGGFLPLDIETHEANLQRTRADIEGFSRISDGLLFGYIGVDAGLSVIPVIGSIYTVSGSLWLLTRAFKVRASWSDKIWIIVLMIIDGAVGFVGVLSGGLSIVLDTLLRVHAWSGKRLVQHIDIQLSAIDRTRSHLTIAAHQASHEVVLQGLRDTLYRGGKTQQEAWLRLGLIVAACVALLAYCDYQESKRQLKITACEQRGAWFCSMRY